MAFKKRLGWTSQPQEAVGLSDLAVSLGCKSATMFGVRGFDAALQRPPASVDSGATWVPTQHGIAFRGTGGEAIALGVGGFSGIVPVDAPAWHIMMLVNVATTGSRRIFLGDFDSGGINESVLMEQEAAGTWRFYWITAAPLQLAVSGGTVTTGWHWVELVADATSTRGYVDGTLIGSTVAASTRRAGADYRIGRPGAFPSVGFDGDIAAHLVFASSLSDQARADIRATPQLLFAPRSKLIGGAAGGGTPTLTVPDSSHAHTLDNVVLTSNTTLAVQDMAHGHALDAPTLSTGTALTVADAQHAHTLDTPTLSTGTALTVADAQHAHTLDNVTLSTTGATSLTVADSLHAHTLDAVGLTSQAYLAVADMLHAHALDNAVLTLGGINLAVFDLAHTHALDNTALTLDTYLAVADLLHTHTFDNVVLSIPAVFTYAANASLYLGIGSDLSILLGGPRMPFWTTAGRPAAPLDGIYGLNKDTNAIEVWDGANWV